MKETSAACMAIAVDLDPAPIPPGAAPCGVAVARLGALRSKLAASGARLSVNVRSVSCAIPQDELARCAGECLTGAADVVSRVECSAVGASPLVATPDVKAGCAGDFKLPNAPAACVTQCQARTLRALRCSADVTVSVDGAPVDEALASAVGKLQRDVPRVVALGTDVVTRVAKLTREVPTLVDDVGATVDAMTSGGSPAERRLALGAVLATCFAPPLARTMEASTRLAASLDDTKQLHTKLASP